MHLQNIPNLLLINSTTSEGNMSFARGEKEEVHKNRKEFLQKHEIQENNAIFLNLEHGNTVVAISSNSKKEITADAAITNKKNAFLCMVTADCLPLFLFDPKTHVIGLIHASRKNIDKIIKNTVYSIEKDLNVNPENLLVYIGPSIGPCHYEVDLWSVAKKILTSVGVLEKNIDLSTICTYENKNYFSHRRAMKSSEPDYRFASVIGMRM